MPGEDEVGTKVAGLFDLPLPWTPPFIVVTNAAREALSSRGSLPSGWLKDLATDAGLAKALNLLLDGSNELIARSSASEVIEDRGQMRSVECPADTEAVEAGVVKCWKANETLLSANDCLAVILQPKLQGRRVGHLSNERRVSERHDSWLVEEWVMEPPEPHGLSIRLGPVGAEEVDLGSALTCEEPRELTRRLRQVAAAALGARGRRHYEWVWDGARLWIVQRDFEKTPKGEPPASRWISTPPVPIGKLRLWVRDEDAIGGWAKADCVKTFRECGFPSQTVFVLEDRGVLEDLTLGRVPPLLQADIETLIEGPLVVRSDVSPTTDRSGLMLPRTETCSSASQVEDFLKETARCFAAGGTPPSKVAFLAHRFIPATAGSYSYAIPGVPRIRTDSIWGVPDGLLYFAHDSFEYDIEAGHTTWRKPRCKRDYVDFNRDGTWFEKMAGTPWDWRESLTEDQRGTIASQTRALADHVGHSVELMHFVGVHPDTGLPDCLPWFFRQRESVETGSEDYVLRLGRPAFVVTSPTDFDVLETRLDSEASQRFSSFRLRPTPEHIHVGGFVEAAAEFANTHNLTIDLEGSVLSHVYYLLKRAGAKVRIVDREEPPPVRGIQRFNKLVRDQIPKIIERGGERAVVVRASAPELIELLKRKMVEEAVELQKSTGRDSLMEEAADVFEVLRAVCAAVGEDVESAIALAEEKRAARGGFEGGYVLKGTYITPVVGSERSEQLFDIEVDDEAARRLRRPDRVVIVEDDLGEGLIRFRVPLWLAEGSRDFRHDLRKAGLRGQVRFRAEESHIVIEISHGRRDPNRGGQLTLPIIVESPGPSSED